jgi:D-3-phosphoglycerate dehydrogenase
MANEDFFSALQQRPFIINTSRGGVIETGSLIKAIGQDLIRGAALDVLENEKIGALNSQEQANLDFLCAQENVLITPHIAGYSHEAYYKMSRILLQKLDIDP